VDDELFYHNDNTLMVAPVNTGATFEKDTPKVLFSGDQLNLVLQNSGRGYDIAPDGRIVTVQEVSSGESAWPVITLVQDWAAAFERE